MSRPRRSRLDDRLGQRRDVAEAEIEALPGDRVDAVGGIAGEREAPATKARASVSPSGKARGVPSGVIAPS